MTTIILHFIELPELRMVLRLQRRNSM